MTRLDAKIADGPVLRLIESFLKADILDGRRTGRRRKVAARGSA